MCCSVSFVFPVNLHSLIKVHTQNHIIYALQSNLYSICLKTLDFSLIGFLEEDRTGSERSLPRPYTICDSGPGAVSQVYGGGGVLEIYDSQVRSAAGNTQLSNASCVKSSCLFLIDMNQVSIGPCIHDNN